MVEDIFYLFNNYFHLFFLKNIHFQFRIFEFKISMIRHLLSKCLNRKNIHFYTRLCNMRSSSDVSLKSSISILSFPFYFQNYLVRVELFHATNNPFHSFYILKIFASITWPWRFIISSDTIGRLETFCISPSEKFMLCKALIYSWNSNVTNQVFAIYNFAISQRVTRINTRYINTRYKQNKLNRLFFNRYKPKGIISP